MTNTFVNASPPLQIGLALFFLVYAYVLFKLIFSAYFRAKRDLERPNNTKEKEG